MLEHGIKPVPYTVNAVYKSLFNSVICLSVTYIGPKSRTERPRKTKIGTEVAHVKRDLDSAFKVKGHQAALLTAM